MKTGKSVSVCMSILFAACMLMTACAAPAATGTPLPTASPTAVPTATVSPSPTPEPSPTPSPAPEPTATPTQEPTASPAPTVDPDAPPVLRLYNRGTRKLVAQFSGKWVKGRNIAEFFALPTDKASVEKSAPKALIEKYWGKYREDGKYKIGYRVSFTLKSGEAVTLNIRSPKDAPKDPKKYFYQFVEIYMYDNAKKDPDGDYGTWHLQERFMTEDTLITSIKLTAGRKIAEVTAIDLTAFVYQGDGDFNAQGEYTGNLSYHIPVNQA